VLVHVVDSKRFGAEMAYFQVVLVLDFVGNMNENVIRHVSNVKDAVMCLAKVGHRET